MKRLLLLGFLVGLAAPGAPTLEPLPAGVIEVPVAATVVPAAVPTPAAPEILVEESYEVHEPIVVEVQGSQATWYLWADSETFRCREADDGKRLYVWAPPGRHKLKCTLLTVDWETRAATKAVVRAEFLVGQAEPQPDPDPDPQPEPDPLPEPSPAVFGVIIEERDQRDDLGPQRSMIFESAKVRELFAAGAFQVRDDDVVDQSGKMPEDIGPYIQRARLLGLPALFLVDADGQVVYEGALPVDVPATVKLIEGYLK